MDPPQSVVVGRQWNFFFFMLRGRALGERPRGAGVDWLGFATEH